jgi:hypothetical protein
MVLKHFSAITKAFATACEMLLTGFLSNILTGTVLTLGFYVSFAMVRRTCRVPVLMPCASVRVWSAA